MARLGALVIQADSPRPQQAGVFVCCMRVLQTLAMNGKCGW